MADPGTCPNALGRGISGVAQLPGSNAGPNSNGYWDLGFPGPDTPGQLIKNGCQPGNSNH